MSVTNGFESKCREIGDHWCHEPAFERDDVLELLAHARAIEAMLKKHEWAYGIGMGACYCPECHGYNGTSLYNSGHSPDCQLAKLIEGVE